jgi:predicted membrane-bound spermidine synthase
MNALLYFIVLLSGVAGLIFETLWFRQAGLVLGNSVWASSLVLASFMGGLACGNALISRYGERIARPVRFYACLELTIAVAGVSLVYALPQLGGLAAAWLRPVLDEAWLSNLLRVVISFSVLLVPSTVMGATLPLLVAALFRVDPRFGSVLGRLYGWNTLGAVLGALAGDVALVEWLGIRGTAWVAGGLDACAAALAIALTTRLGGSRAPARIRKDPPRLSGRSCAFLMASFILGALLLGLEVVWFRFLLLFVHGTSLAFASMLAVVLAGIGCGGLVGSLWLTRSRSAEHGVAATAFAAGALACVVYAGFALLPQAAVGSNVLDGMNTLRVAIPLAFPVSLLSGVLFALLGEALHNEAEAPIRSAGLLTLANTTGAMLGSLLAGFVLLPGLGVERSIHVLTAGYAGVGVLLALAQRPLVSRERALLAGAGLVCALAVAFFPSGLMEARYLAVAHARFTADGSRVVALREGLSETITYIEHQYFGERSSIRLLTNGFSMSGTATIPRRYMKLYVYIPFALHEDPKNALLISYGVGATAKALTDRESLDRIDVVDTSRDILELSHIVYPDPSEHPLHDPRVHVHVEDGRHFLQMTRRRFDLITGEPPPPTLSTVVNLYSREYFELARNALAEGGFITYWLPVNQLEERSTLAIIAGFCEVFEDCSLWNGSGFNWMLMGSRNGTGAESVEAFARQWNRPSVASEMAVPPLDDDHPKRLSGRGTNRKQRHDIYLPWMDVDAARQRFAASPFIRRLWPAPLREATLPFFAIQAELNRFTLLKIKGVGRELPHVHRALTQTRLQTLPLWLMGSDADAQRAVQAAFAKDSSHPGLRYQFAARALAARDYLRAAELFGAERARGGGWRWLLHYEIYALLMAEEREAASDLAEGLVTGADSEFSRFLWKTFQLDSPMRKAPELRR